MAGELTQKGANRAIQAGLGNAVSAAAGMYIALATAIPTNPDTDDLLTFSSAELTTAGYSRQSVTWGTPSGDPSEIANTNVLNFGTFTADPPSVTHCFLCTAASGTTGDVLAYWQLDSPVDAGVGDALVFGVGDLKMSVD